MPHGKKGITLSINKERLLDAPVPTEDIDVDENIEEDVEEEPDREETDEKNSALIEMGVAFPPSAV